MNSARRKIIVDLEFNPITDPELKPKAQHEIIEIGAVMLDGENNSVSSFQEYIKPRFNEITPKVTKITGITNGTVENSAGFEEVIARFMEWANEGEPRFYSWSSTDITVLSAEILLKLGEECPEREFFCKHWVDLQKIYQRVMGFRKNMGLTNALGTLMIAFEGKEHGALADAENTAEILKVLCDKEKINEIKNSPRVTYNDSTHSSGGFTMGNLFAEQFAKIRK